MNKEDLINNLHNMQKPDISGGIHQQQLKMTLLNSRRSANFGIVLVIVPCLFLVGIFLKYLLHVPLPLFSAAEEWLAE
jgi:hypothetical protein